MFLMCVSLSLGMRLLVFLCLCTLYGQVQQLAIMQMIHHCLLTVITTQSRYVQTKLPYFGHTLHLQLVGIY